VTCGNECLWCDDPTEGKLCAGCRKVHDHPLFYCQVNPKHTPTLGDSCAECDFIAQAQAKARRAAVNAPIIEQLKAIRAQHVREWHKPWPGVEFGKALFGMMLDKAIEELES
jgi:hypothetical protein